MTTVAALVGTCAPAVGAESDDCGLLLYKLRYAVASQYQADSWDSAWEGDWYRSNDVRLIGRGGSRPNGWTPINYQ